MCYNVYYQSYTDLSKRGLLIMNHRIVRSTNHHEHEGHDEHELTGWEVVDRRADDKRQRRGAHRRQKQIEIEDDELEYVRLQSWVHDNVAAAAHKSLTTMTTELCGQSEIGLRVTFVHFHQFQQ